MNEKIKIKGSDYEEKLRTVKKLLSDPTEPHCLKLAFRAVCEVEKNLIKAMSEHEKINDAFLIKTIRKIGIIMISNFIDEIKNHEPILMLKIKTNQTENPLYCSCLIN